MINSVSCRNHFDPLLYFIQETCFFLIFTGDHSRVTLDTKEGGDYINANAIKVHNSGAHRLRQRQDNFFRVLHMQSVFNSVVIVRRHPRSFLVFSTPKKY